MTNPMVGPAREIRYIGQDYMHPEVGLTVPAEHAGLVALTDELEVARVVHSGPALNADHRQGQAIHSS